MFVICTSLTMAFSEVETLIFPKNIYIRLLNTYDSDYVFLGVRAYVEGGMIRKQKYSLKTQTIQAPS